MRWLKALPKISHSPSIAESMRMTPVRVRDDVLVEDVEPPGAGDPAELAVEDEEADEAEPEHRHRIAEEPDDADDVVGPASLAGAGQNARRNADQHADDDGDRWRVRRSRETRAAGRSGRAARSAPKCRNRRSRCASGRCKYWTISGWSRPSAI